MPAEDAAGDPTRVWVLIMWETPGSRALVPHDPSDWPSPGAFMGAYATREAALQELEAECEPEELAEMRWVSPVRNNPDYQELRGPHPDRVWFSLDHTPIRERAAFAREDAPDGR